MELKKLNDAVTSIHDEMFYLRERYKFIYSFCFYRKFILETHLFIDYKDRDFAQF